MARHTKKGMDYFSLDIDFFSDKKIKILKARYGADGIVLYVYLLCEIYKNGYYLEIDDDYEYVISDDLNMDSNKVKQVMHFLLERSLFENTLFQSDKVLTSAGIQKRFQLMVKTRAVKNPILIKRFWLLKKEETETFIKVQSFLNNSENKEDNSEKNNDNSEKNDIKESKVKESKEKNKSTIAEGSEKPIILLPLKSGEDYPVQKETLDYFKEIYPTVDILRELKKMQAWLYSNADKGKTKTGIKRFINNWLSKSSVSVQVVVKDEKSKPKNKFNNFNQRTYDYAELEKQLLDVNKEQEAKN
jgi:hypothetical protein